MKTPTFKFNQAVSFEQAMEICDELLDHNLADDYKLKLVDHRYQAMLEISEDIGDDELVMLGALLQQSQSNKTSLIANFNRSRR